MGGLAAQDDKTLIKFPGAKWAEQDDPVMGGQSHGNWSVMETFGRFQGSVKNVSFIHAPGFCRTVTAVPLLKDAAAYIDGGLLLTARTSTPAYKGFKLSFGAVGAPKHHGGHISGCYKTKFNIPASPNGEFQRIFLKFSEFSYDWSDFTGECSTKDPDGFQHHCCSAANLTVCPDKARLTAITGFSIWAEGAEGDFDVDLKEI